MRIGDRVKIKQGNNNHRSTYPEKEIEVVITDFLEPKKHPCSNGGYYDFTATYLGLTYCYQYSEIITKFVFR